jgi:hypothetical protein
LHDSSPPCQVDATDARNCAGTITIVAEPTTDQPTETSTSVAVTPTTLIGPNGTAPGMTFIEQQEQPIIDAQPGRAAGAPLAIAAVALLIIFSVILIRAALANRRDPKRTSR